jgi:hypothetical protein
MKISSAYPGYSIPPSHNARAAGGEAFAAAAPDISAQNKLAQLLADKRDENGSAIDGQGQNFESPLGLNIDLRV